MRERDKRILQSAKLIMAFGAAAFCLLVWVVNRSNPELAVVAFKSGVDVLMFCLGAHVSVLVSDSVEAMITHNKTDSTTTVSEKREPKDFDVPLSEVYPPNGETDGR